MQTLVANVTLAGPDGRGVRARPRKQRADIQALRTIAVGIVVAYHFFPTALPGGFVGVDVFFVISGFLITAHLIEKPPTTLRNLAEFWGRRIRRLLPASFVVLTTTFLATVLFAPQTVWSQTARHIAASALYVQNWILAGDAVDYLAADDTASSVQHFWSLSVEEQFYLFWPILIFCAGIYAARRSSQSLRGVIFAVIAVITVASFLTSIVLTAVDSSSAYFITWTRAWELGAGALAACAFPALRRWLRGRPSARTILAWMGLFGIVASAVTFDKALPFPGAVAAIPVASTALVLVADVAPGKFSPYRFLRLRPVQIGGDLSYSIYLWHWPALILLPVILNHEVRGWQKLIVIVGVVAVSWATKRWVEDRFRGQKPLGVPLYRSFVFAGVGMLVFSVAAFATVASVGGAQASEQSRVDQLITSDAPCVGASSMRDPSCDPHGSELITSPVFAAGDRPAPYDDDCWILGNFSEVKTCTYGSDDPGAKRVALVGNSHAGHWLPALQELARVHKWRITTFLISECYTVDVEVDFTDPAKVRNCSAWNQQTIDRVASGEFDLVVFSNRTSQDLVGLDRTDSLTAAKASYGRVLDRWTAAGVRTLVLRDTPYAFDLKNVPDCVAAAANDLAACDGDRSRDVPDPLADAARTREGTGNVGLLDLTDRICRGQVCQSIVGGVIVYFDRGHLTATFARTLAPDIWAAVKELE